MPAHCTCDAQNAYLRITNPKLEVLSVRCKGDAVCLCVLGVEQVCLSGQNVLTTFSYGALAACNNLTISVNSQQGRA